MAAPLGDLELLEERFQKIFWGMEYHDLLTIAFSVVVIDGKRREITTVNENKIHAEIQFIEQVKTFIRSRQLIGPIQGVDITINLSKSPCFTCREDLEDFFESLTKRGTTVTFTLRIANLYFGDDRNQDKNIKDLAFWLNHLNRENIVNMLEYSANFSCQNTL